jgi:hypothetical protein
MTRYNKLLILDDQGPIGNLRVEMRAVIARHRITTRANLTNWSCWPSKFYRLTAAWLSFIVQSRQ